MAPVGDSCFVGRKSTRHQICATTIREKAKGSGPATATTVATAATADPTNTTTGTAAAYVELEMAYTRGNYTLYSHLRSRVRFPLVPVQTLAHT